MRLLSRIALGIALLLSACAPPSAPTPPAAPALTLKSDTSASPSRWQGEERAFIAFRRSCELIVKKPDGAMLGQGRLAAPYGRWKPACRAALARDEAAYHGFFAQYFLPYRAGAQGNAQAYLTGYYVPDIRGSRVKTARYNVPLYKRPPELKNDAPYMPRRAIEDGALKGRGLELFWVDDPVDAFFLQVQGSGTLVTEKGERIGIAFAGKNNLPYVSLGKVMAERGLMRKEEITLFSLKSWLRSHPQQARALMQENPSFVFFREAAAGEVIGSFGVGLTPRASLAVDPAYIPYGMPVYVQSNAFSGLMVAQDTGTAIRGPLRGDVFFGSGPAVEAEAGGLKSPAQWVLLLPREVAAYAGL